MTIRPQIFLAIALTLAPAFAAAATPAPKPRPLPTPHLPNERLHTDFNVEVNKLGQVVRVKSGKSCKNLTFNAQTYGNVLQMWIRRPDGTAVVGMYRVNYDYDPKTHIVSRSIALLTRGGNWANEEGAANEMMDLAKRQQARDAAKHANGNDATKNLPDIQGIVRRDVHKTSASPSPHP